MPAPSITWRRFDVYVATHALADGILVVTGRTCDELPGHDGMDAAYDHRGVRHWGDPAHASLDLEGARRIADTLRRDRIRELEAEVARLRALDVDTLPVIDARERAGCSEPG